MKLLESSKTKRKKKKNKLDFIKIKNFWASRDAIVKILPREWEKIFADCMSDISNPRCADDTALMAESEEELKSLLMKVKEEREKASFKFNIKKTNIMVLGPTASGQIEGEKSGSGDIFYFLGL